MGKLLQAKVDGEDAFFDANETEDIVLTDIDSAADCKYFGKHNKVTGFCFLFFAIKYPSAVTSDTIFAVLPAKFRNGVIRGLSISFNNGFPSSPTFTQNAVSISASGSIYQGQTNNFTQTTSIFMWFAN